MVIDDQIDRFARGVSVYDCKRDNKKEGESSAKFIMTDNGLQCKVDTLVIPQTAKQKAIADSVARANNGE